MQRLIQRAFLLTAVVFSAFACLVTPWVVAQELTPAGDTHVFAGTSSTHTIATVVGIEAATNSVLLRGARGNLVKVEVDQNIGDVKRLKIGDKVGITYVRALLLHAEKVDAKGIRERVDTETTTPAVRGATTTVHRVQVIATVMGIDAAKRAVTLRRER